MAKDHVYNLIILDESGSMEAIKDSTIAGFNEVVQTIKGVETRYPEQKHFISFVTFNGLGIKTLLDKKPVSGIDMIDGNTYNPNSLTPLYDAIALSVLKLRMDIASVQNTHVLVTILTDGQENDSKEFSGSQVKKIIDEQKSRGWTFTYIGANHNVEEAAASISITNTMNFVAENSAVHKMFLKEKTARLNFCHMIHLNEATGDDFYAESEGNAGKSPDRPIA